MSATRMHSDPHWIALFGLAMAACSPGSVTQGDAGGDARDVTRDAVRDVPPSDTPAVDSSMDVIDAAEEAAPDVPEEIAPDVSTPDVQPDVPMPTELDLHECTLSNNPPDLADWPITTTITRVQFSNDGVHVEFSKRDGPDSWPDITPPGWDGPLEYTLGLAEYIDGHWYCSAAIQFWRGLYASGGNVASDVGTMGQCTAFGHNSTCQVARNWYYDGRWGNLQLYQPATNEVIGVFVVGGNVRGVTDGSQSPARERSNVVLVRMPDLSGADYSF